QSRPPLIRTATPSVDRSASLAAPAHSKPSSPPPQSAPAPPRTSPHPSASRQTAASPLASSRQTLLANPPPLQPEPRAALAPAQSAPRLPVARPTPCELRFPVCAGSPNSSSAHKFRSPLESSPVPRTPPAKSC